MLASHDGSVESLVVAVRRLHGDMEAVAAIEGNDRACPRIVRAARHALLESIRSVEAMMVDTTDNTPDNEEET